VVDAGDRAVTSIDTMVDGVHFRLAGAAGGWASPADVGHRALAGALSDLAAMGALAGEAYVSLVLPEDMGEERALELMRGAEALAGRCHTTICGGDVVSGPALVVTVAVVGWASATQPLVGRDGAQPGDRLGVTGELGAAGAALALLEDQVAPETVSPATREALLERLLRPRPRLQEGQQLAAAGAHAMIDLSDGLAADAAQLARASDVRIEIDLDALPLANGVSAVAGELRRPGWWLGAGSGEDYELCVCAAPGEELAGVHWVGRVGEGEPRVLLSDHEGEQALTGYEHL
jgi:thiamine-monophosphate kinase